jgi:hypothetical protein
MNSMTSSDRYRLLEGYKGQARLSLPQSPPLSDLCFILQGRECMTALLMEMLVCCLVYTGLDYRIHNAFKDHGGVSYPAGHTGTNRPARWNF